jgi:hypothetical protein
MSRPHRNEQGITKRHGRGCGSRSGSRCDCKQMERLGGSTSTRSRVFLPTRRRRRQGQATRKGRTRARVTAARRRAQTTLMLNARPRMFAGGG